MNQYKNNKIKQFQKGELDLNHNEKLKELICKNITRHEENKDINMEIEKKLSKQLSMPEDSVDNQNSDINQSLIQKDKIQKNNKIDN